MSSRSFRVGRSVTGLGLFATKPIKRGAYITAYRGRRITTEEADRRAARGASYMFELNKRWTIDGSPRWNVARYINHSCRPNAKPVGRRGGIVIVALRRIEPREEITYDYGREYVKCFLENGGCRCAACRRKRALRRRRARAANRPNKLAVSVCVPRRSPSVSAKTRFGSPGCTKTVNASTSLSACFQLVPWQRSETHRRDRLACWRSNRRRQRTHRMGPRHRPPRV
jgi:hypothetical protein